MSAISSSLSLQSRSDLHKTINIPELIQKKVQEFQNHKGDWITSNCQHIFENNIHYYGIHKNDQVLHAKDACQTVIDTRKIYLEMRSHILQIMNVSPNTDVIQVVGDSQTFSLEGSLLASKFLEEHIPLGAVVAYGYTGTVGKDGTRCVNATVSKFIEKRDCRHLALGNLVGYHSPSVLSKSDGHEPTLNHYVIVYSDDETVRERGTLFGDDVTTSDYFAGKLLMLEGGAQSFLQACNALLLDQKIITCMGIRQTDKTKIVDTDGTTTEYFSASRFLFQILQLIKSTGESFTDEILKDWYQDYFDKGKCYIVNPSRPDLPIKQKLLNDAWDEFIKHKLYLKIESLIEFNFINHKLKQTHTTGTNHPIESLN